MKHRTFVAAAVPPDQAWHARSAAEVCAHFGADPERGLDAATVTARADQHGPNAIREAPPKSIVAMLVGQFADFMIVVLIVAAIVSGVLGDIEDTLAILAIVVLNAGIGFVQEIRAEKAMAALRQLAAGTAQVVRDGAVSTVPMTALVPGDFVVLEAGNLVPADIRLVLAKSLRIDESLLTGESVAVDKDPAALAAGDRPPATADSVPAPADRDSANADRVSAAAAAPPPVLPLGDRINMAYKGALVTHGRGRGVVVATGMATELGHIASLLEASKPPLTPLQQRLAAFGRRLGVAILAICAVVFAIGLVRGEPALPLFLTAVSLAVAAIPEALPAVVTIALALGAARMARAHALIRRLPAVETLGSVTVICTDKTGTLTQNRMQVAAIASASGILPEVIPPDGGSPGRGVPGGGISGGQRAAASEPLRTLFTAIALCNDATRNPHGQPSGDPTEVALVEAAAAAGFERADLDVRLPRVGEWPFDAERQRMTTLHITATGSVAYMKGAPERVLPRCTTALGGDGTESCDSAAILATAESLAADGLRVLAVATRDLGKGEVGDSAEAIEQDLVFVGLVGLIDPPRAEVAAAVALCTSAGIIPVMITGDHPATALAIARQVGIATAGDQVLSGGALAALSDAELAQRAPSTRVYARVDPEQKIRIVAALQCAGAVVAMTGDGVNDAPALKRADIGVAMGRGGTDVAREASSLILLDDNFATIVAAVRAGRQIYDNIRKFIRFVMTGNAGEIWTIFAAPLLGLPLPLLPIQILWINFVTDGLPGLALAVEPAERGLMERPPRPPRENIFAHGMWQHIVWVGLLIGAVSLLAQAWSLEAGATHSQTIVFTVLTFAQLAHVLAIRSERESLFTQGIGSNRPLLLAVAISAALHLAMIYVPAANAVMHTTPLELTELAICSALAGVVFVAVEIEKWAVRRGWLYAEPASD